MRGVGGFVLLEHYKEFYKFSMTYQYNFEMFSVLFLTLTQTNLILLLIFEFWIKRSNLGKVDIS